MWFCDPNPAYFLQKQSGQFLHDHLLAFSHYVEAIIIDRLIEWTLKGKQVANCLFIVMDGKTSAVT